MGGLVGVGNHECRMDVRFRWSSCGDRNVSRALLSTTVLLFLFDVMKQSSNNNDIQEAAPKYQQQEL